jgi:hypothetical protein
MFKVWCCEAYFCWVSAVFTCIIFRYSLTVIHAYYRFCVPAFLECCLRFAASEPWICLFRLCGLGPRQGTCNAKTEYHLLPYKLDMLPTDSLIWILFRFSKLQSNSAQAASIESLKPKLKVSPKNVTDKGVYNTCFCKDIYNAWKANTALLWRLSCGSH